MGRSLTGTDDLVAFQIQRAKTQTIKKKREREKDTILEKKNHLALFCWNIATKEPV